MMIVGELILFISKMGMESVCSIIRMCVCVHVGLHCRRRRLAPANRRNPGRQDRRAAPVCCFVVPKMGPKTGPKNGTAILPEEGKVFKMAAPFLGPGFCIHSQPPLRAVSSGDSGTFRLFSWQWAWQSLIQVSQYVVFSCFAYGFPIRNWNFPPPASKIKDQHPSIY